MTEGYDILEILYNIDPEKLDYQSWVNVGMALKEEGYSVSDWEAWSRADAGRYHPGECARKWGSFNGAASPVTGGTLVQMAKDQGWNPERDAGYELEWDGVIRRDAGMIVDKNWLESREITALIQRTAWGM